MKFSTKSLSAALLLSVAGLGIGCASNHQEGVTSDYRTQWTT
ncbi:MAG: hypothetical protein JWM57_870, partial [Phycisphaerales bacterium]|nr:hypothetical protein [Phycisphaerales bacterium]